MSEDTKNFGNVTLNCEIVQDLLPLYHDEAVSEVTKNAVRQHIEMCDECRAECETYDTKLDIESPAEISTAEKFANTMKKEKRKRRVLTAVFSILGCIILLTGVILLTQVPLIYDSSDYAPIAAFKENTDALFILYERPMYTNDCVIYDSTDYDEEKGIYELNEETRRPIIAWLKKDEPKTIGSLYVSQEEYQDVTEIKFNGETIWTEDTANDLPDYVYEYAEAAESGFKTDVSYVFGDGVWKIRFEYPDGSVKEWDLDGNLAADEVTAD